MPVALRAAQLLDGLGVDAALRAQLLPPSGQAPVTLEALEALLPPFEFDDLRVRLMPLVEALGANRLRVGCPPPYLVLSTPSTHLAPAPIC